MMTLAIVTLAALVIALAVTLVNTRRRLRALDTGVTNVTVAIGGHAKALAIIQRAFADEAVRDYQQHRALAVAIEASNAAVVNRFLESRGIDPE